MQQAECHRELEIDNYRQQQSLASGESEAPAEQAGVRLLPNTEWIRCLQTLIPKVKRMRLPAPSPPQTMEDFPN